MSCSNTESNTPATFLVSQKNSSLKRKQSLQPGPHLDSGGDSLSSGGQAYGVLGHILVNKVADTAAAQRSTSLSRKATHLPPKMLLASCGERLILQLPK